MLAVSKSTDMFNVQENLGEEERWEHLSRGYVVIYKQ